MHSINPSENLFPTYVKTRVKQDKCDLFFWLRFRPLCSGTAWGRQWTATHTSLSVETLSEGSWSTQGTGCCCSVGTWLLGPVLGSTGTAELDSE